MSKVTNINIDKIFNISQSKMKEKIKIPTDVVDKTEYLKYYAFSQSPILKNTIIETSDGGEINIAMFTH